MKKVLVFPCDSEIGLEINRALAYSRHFELFGASSLTSGHGDYVYKNYIGNLPYVTDPDFIDCINKIICDNKIDYIIPAHDSVTTLLSEKMHEIACEVITPPFETCRICRSKKATYEFFEKIIATPKVYSIDDTFEYPVFLKPEVGQGSKGTHIARNIKEIEFYLKQDPTLMILEYLPGKEYTIDCFSNRDRQLLFSAGRERAKTSNGISTHTYPVNDERFEVMAKKINEKLDLRGVWFFQVKERDNGDLVLMEISPRIAGSMGLYRNLGINFVLLTLFDRMGMDVSVLKNDYYIEMGRTLSNKFKLSISYNKVYIDLDDTIIVNNQINTAAIAFVYQCISKKIEVNLITRHNKNITDTLKRYRMLDLFDNVIYVADGKEKYEYIDSDGSIFIDDSYSERLKVFKKCKIPTFDITSFESLMDWRV